MVKTILNAAPISDVIEWDSKGLLELNPDFQRRSVWSQPAKVYLIDTILRELSIPKIYIRTRIDLQTKSTIREVVDGQQRLRAILEFANNKYKLTRRANEFEGYQYNTLPPELQEKFLSYSLAIELLANASDNDVLEVFSRLNSYSETLNAVEIRHAEFQGLFRSAVDITSKKYADLWARFKIIGLRSRMRMADDALIAELYGILIDGVMDGSNKYMDGLYDRYDKVFPHQADIEAKLDRVLKFMTTELADYLLGPLGRRPNFIMLFAAIAHSMFGIPSNKNFEAPVRKKLADTNIMSIGLSRLVEALESTEENDLAIHLRQFKIAATSSTQRIKSRKVRFGAFYEAIVE